MTIQELEVQIEQLSQHEKTHIFGRLVHDLIDAWPGVEKTSDIQGGDACIVRTRIPIWLLESYRRLGWTEQQILDNFPTLRSPDLAVAWLYVDTHRSEIDLVIVEQEAA